MHAMLEAAKDATPSRVCVTVPPTDPSHRPYRPPDYAEEWKLLRKAWSLARNGRTELSEMLIAKASEEFYPPGHSLDNLSNWVWRLATFLCNPSYEPVFDAAIKAMEPLNDSILLWDFRQYYKTVASERGVRYFNIMADFFTAYSEFSQVYFFISKGLEIPDNYHATSTDFEAVKMFYGNVYEHFTNMVDYLAMLNNMSWHEDTILFRLSRLTNTGSSIDRHGSAPSRITLHSWRSAPRQITRSETPPIMAHWYSIRRSRLSATV